MSFILGILDLPAKPVTAIDTLASAAISPPSAISLTTSSETTPNFFIVSPFTPTSVLFASSQYVTKACFNIWEAPGTLAIFEAIIPAVQDSTVVISKAP